MNFLSRKSVLSLLLVFSMLSIIGINHYQLSYATSTPGCTVCGPDCQAACGICSFDPENCGADSSSSPQTRANFHLDEAKKSIDDGDYTGAKNHIDQAKQIIAKPSK